MKPTTLEIWKRLDARLESKANALRLLARGSMNAVAQEYAVHVCRDEILLELEQMDREQSLNETKP